MLIGGQFYSKICPWKHENDAFKSSKKKFQYCQPAQNQPKSHFLSHKNISHFMSTIDKTIPVSIALVCQFWTEFSLFKINPELAVQYKSYNWNGKKIIRQVPIYQ